MKSKLQEFCDKYNIDGISNIHIDINYFLVRGNKDGFIESGTLEKDKYKYISHIRYRINRDVSIKENPTDKELMDILNKIGIKISYHTQILIEHNMGEV